MNLYVVSSNVKTFKSANKKLNLHLEISQIRSTDKCRASEKCRCPLKKVELR